MRTVIIIFFVFTILLSAAYGENEDCFTYNFEDIEDLTNTFYNTGTLCMSTDWWILRHYSAESVQPFDPRSTMFMSTSGSQPNCVSTRNYHMNREGYFEINFSIENDPSTLTIWVSEYTSNTIFAALTVTQRSEWNTSRIPLNQLDWEYDAPEEFIGYISIHGQSPQESLIMVDSFRYIPPSASNEEECNIYEDSTEEPTTEQTTDEISKEISEDCITFNFEDIDDLTNAFNNTGPLCMSTDWWILRHYSTVSVKPFDRRSTMFMSTSGSQPNCVSTLNYHMNRNGNLEVILYIENESSNLVIRVSEYMSNTAVGEVSLNQRNKWIISKIPLNLHWENDEPEEFIGYISFFGESPQESRIMVDSFRYIPPSATNEEECNIYEDSAEEPTTEQTTDEKSKEISEGCFTFNFEDIEDLTNTFYNTGTLCMSTDWWVLRHYSAESVQPFDPRSTMFMSTTGSQANCVSTRNYHMNREGYLEVNFYIENDPSTLTIWVSEYMSNTVFAALTVTQRSEWNTSRIPLNVLNWEYDAPEEFIGYISFMGQSPDSLIIVDSFRYMSSLLIEEDCIIYDDNLGGTTEITTEETTEEPSEGTTEDPSDGTTEEPSDETTEDPSEEPTNFWSALSITLVSIACVIVFLLLLFGIYRFGVSRATKNLQATQMDDYEYFPRPNLLPRVKNYEDLSMQTRRF